MIAVDFYIKDITINNEECKKLSSIKREFLFTFESILKQLSYKNKDKIQNVEIRLLNEDNYKGHMNRLGSKTIVVDFNNHSMIFGLPKEKTIHHLYESIEVKSENRILFYKIINKFIDKQEDNIKYINNLLNQNNVIKRLNKKIKD